MKIRDYVMMTGAVCVLATGTQALEVDDADEMVPVVIEQEEAAQDPTKKDEKGFELLVQAMSVRGLVEVMNPDVGAFAPVVNNKAYPLGSVFRTGAGGSMVAFFSRFESVQMFANTEIAVLAGKDSAKTRDVRLVKGRVRTFLRDNLLEGQFSVETPNASCKNMAGKADFTLSMNGENEVFEAKVITGALRMEGPQYTIGALRAANTVNVLTTPNRSLSHLTGVSGDYKITLDNETDTPVGYDMSPKAVVKIWRDAPKGGGNMVVSALVVSPTGKARHHFAYVVGRGELIADGATDMLPEDDQENLQLVLPAEKEKDSKKPVKPAPKAVKDALPDEEEGSEL